MNDNVDDIRKETLKFYNQTGIVKNNILGDGFIQNTIETVQSGEVEYDYQKIDMAKVTGSTKDFINTKAASYLGRPSAANNLWNHQLQQGRNILGKDNKPLYPDGFKLKLADGQIGTAFDTETSKVFTESLAQYMYDILPKGKQGSVRKTSKDKLTQAQINAAKKAGQEKINVQEINELEIPTISDPIRDRFAIAGVKPTIDLKATNKLLRDKGFVTDMAVTDDEGKITVLKVTSSLSGKNQTIQIRKDTDPDTVADLLKQVVTGKRPLPTK